MAIPPAPSAPPTSVSVSEVTSSSINVQWGPVDCIHRNGDITGYSVQYWEVGSGSTQTMSVSGGSTTEATISGLMSSTAYSIQVAAVTSAGTGPYSAAVNHLTAGIKTRYNIMMMHDCTFALYMSVLLFSCSSSLVSWCQYSYLHLPLLDQCWLRGCQL